VDGRLWLLIFLLLVLLRDVNVLWYKDFRLIGLLLMLLLLILGLVMIWWFCCIFSCFMFRWLWLWVIVLRCLCWVGGWLLLCMMLII